MWSLCHMQMSHPEDLTPRMPESVMLRDRQCARIRSGNDAMQPGCEDRADLIQSHASQQCTVAMSVTSSIRLPEYPGCSQSPSGSLPGLLSFLIRLIEAHIDTELFRISLDGICCTPMPANILRCTHGSICHRGVWRNRLSNRMQDARQNHPPPLPVLRRRSCLTV